MKESKQECGKSPKPPMPNLKNKDFLKWSKAELCKKEDNIVSTDWHERLQRLNPFVPVYDNAPLNMAYLMSGEYGRIWQKERDEWYSKVFVPKEKEKDMADRRKKIRKQIREAKKAAEIKIKERKERRAKEIELKAKAEAEKAEKLKAKVQKLATARKPQKTKKKQEAKATAPPAAEADQEACPKGWNQVELTIQCECSEHKKDTTEKEEKREEQEIKTSEDQKTEPTPPTICEDYYRQLKDIQDSKNKEAQKIPQIDPDSSKKHLQSPEGISGAERETAAAQ